MFQLDTVLQEALPDLHGHFVAHAFHASMYSSGWFLTLFTTSLPLLLVCRILDIFLNEVGFSWCQTWFVLDPSKKVRS
jgi:hypothetical protein